MNYGNKLIILVVLSLFLIGCANSIKDFHYELYDKYFIKARDNKIRLYKNDELIKIEDDYNIKEIKYNSDVVCLKLSNNKYYMVYYVDSSIYGPYSKESFDKTIEDDLTMTFDHDFQNILKMDGLEYE